MAKTLSYGSTGSEVSNLQNLLNSNGYSLSVDGIFGDKTLAALKDWQKKYGYTVDGLAGPNTISRLGGTSSTSANSDAEAIYRELIENNDNAAANASGTADATGTAASGDGTTTDTSVSVSGTETTDKDSSAVQAAMDAAKDNEKLTELINQMKVESYTPLTAEQIEQQAKQQYKSYYDQLRLSANQSADKQNLALQQQKEGLQQTYDKQREDMAEQYKQAYSQADRQSLSRGMQRSSYNNQTLSNIDLKAAEAQADLYNEQASAENKISAQQTQLAAQLADQISQYDASEAADVLKRIDEIEAREYDRQTTAENNKNTLSLQIYSIINDQLQQQIENEHWLAEFNENVRQFNAQMAQSSGGGGGGGGYSSGYSSYSKKSSGSKSSSASNSGSELFDALAAANKKTITTWDQGKSVVNNVYRQMVADGQNSLADATNTIASNYYGYTIPGTSGKSSTLTVASNGKPSSLQNSAVAKTLSQVLASKK